jgi:GT2 family glycosyltransferase
MKNKYLKAVAIQSFGQKKNHVHSDGILLMDSTRYTVIVPMARFRADEPVLASLSTRSSGDSIQILVAEGAHPARQRNAALIQAQGEIVIFLDNDCSLDPAYWQELETALARNDVEIVGGPALLRPNAAGWEKIFHALLTHVLIVGTVSSRYRPRGLFRVATQTDLILCNLAVRRSVLEKIGPLSIDLYPNEENEWLDRAQAMGVHAYYDPALRVYRPQRGAPLEMARTLLRYGIGRTRQFRISGWRLTFHQFLPVMVAATLAALIHWRLEMPFVCLWLIASAIVALTCDSSLSTFQRIIAGLIAPLIPLTYAVGQALGWFTFLIPKRAATTPIVVLDEQGTPLP